MPGSILGPRDIMLNLHSRRQDRKTHDYIWQCHIVINVMIENEDKCVAIVEWVIREGLSEEVTFEQRSEKGDRAAMKIQESPQRSPLEYEFSV